MIPWENLQLLPLLDLFGVFVFALSGGFDGAKYRLDWLGIMVLAVATGVGGGVMRDVLLDVTPPVAFQDETYLLTCLAGGLVVILAARRIEKIWQWVRYADAIGLGIFAAIGAFKAAEYGLGVVGVIMISTMTATGGGLIRDLLVREIPMILRSDFYASAAIIGALSLLLTRHLGGDENLQIFIASIAAITSRLVAMRMNLHLPRIKHFDTSGH